MARKFAWSYSRLNSFELCPKRHKLVDLDKRYQEDPSPEMQFGSDLHKALEEYCRDGTPMPPELRTYQKIGDKVRALPGVKYYEVKAALNREFESVEFFARDVWLRGIIDVLVVSEDGTRAAALDYKTGKIKPDMSQLQLCAAMVFAMYPSVQTVDTAFWWVAKGGKLTKASYDRHNLPDLWNKFLPRAEQYEKAVRDDRFPANPSGICRKWCPVTECEFHGGA